MGQEPYGQGTGPGAFTPDGCAVELYSALPAADEPDIVAGAVPAGASLLELGSGVGRVTRPLVDRGFRVVAVDESPEMLERVHGARTVCSSIQSLDLDERFDVVLLASFLVNTSDDAKRAGLLRCCRRHLAPGGSVLIQREGDDWHEPRRTPRETVRGGVLVRVASVEPRGDGSSTVYVTYESDTGSWTHTFVSRCLTEPVFEAELAGAGLEVDAYLTDDRTWVRARARA